MKDRDHLITLVRHIAYAQHWLRDCDVFYAAVAHLGLKYYPGKGLYEVVEQKMKDPYADS